MIEAAGHVTIAIVGSRAYRELWRVERCVGWLVARYGERLVIVSGGAAGVDRAAAYYGRQMIDAGKVSEIKPDYDRWGWGLAPLERNTEIVRACDALIAFWDGQSTGTVDVTGKARQAGKLWMLRSPSGLEILRGAEPHLT